MYVCVCVRVYMCVCVCACGGGGGVCVGGMHVCSVYVGGLWEEQTFEQFSAGLSSPHSSSSTTRTTNTAEARGHKQSPPASGVNAKHAAAAKHNQATQYI